MIQLFFTCRFSVCCWTELGITLNLSMIVSDMILNVRQQFGRSIFREVVIECNTTQMNLLYNPRVFSIISFLRST
ncbi:hypothetical protein HU200_057195 [Digitaria exilis]|uniref:Uncharacterized protein n=1 Tax=Digitaria exilis TaxID=1010633 RepID=A0A835AHW7_9POAL|nr:hypothetical protein HU200_057195 [Digitaria exilis]